MTMDSSLNETLRDQPQQEYRVVAEGDLGRAPAGSPDAWTVVIDQNATPVALLPPGPDHYGPDDLAGSPAFVVADPEMNLDWALKSESFREIEPAAGVVLFAGGQVVGVWGGISLKRALLSGPARGSTLPGTPDVSLIVRRCKYTEGGTVCGSAVSFASRPSTLPPCANPRAFTAHTFNW